MKAGLISLGVIATLAVVGYVNDQSLITPTTNGLQSFLQVEDYTIK